MIYSYDYKFSLNKSYSGFYTVNIGFGLHAP